jgi:hypothetical protein
MALVDIVLNLPADETRKKMLGELCASAGQTISVGFSPTQAELPL